MVSHGRLRASLHVDARRAGPSTLDVRPLLSGRDYHALHRENGAFRFDDRRRGPRRSPGSRTTACRPCAVPTTGFHPHRRSGIRQFLYIAERERGLDDTEDLASPGVIQLHAAGRTQPCACSRRSAATAPRCPRRQATSPLRAEVGGRNVVGAGAFATPLERAADAYLVRRGARTNASSPAIRGSPTGAATRSSRCAGCASPPGGSREARDILLEWAGAVSEGMLPNRFPDAATAPEFNAVDASLWFVVAVHELLDASAAAARAGRAAPCARFRRP